MTVIHMFSQSWECVGPAGPSWSVGVRGGKSYITLPWVPGQMSDLAAVSAFPAGQGHAKEQVGKKGGQAGAKGTASSPCSLTELQSWCGQGKWWKNGVPSTLPQPLSPLLKFLDQLPLCGYGGVPREVPQLKDWILTGGLDLDLD